MAAGICSPFSRHAAFHTPKDHSAELVLLDIDIWNGRWFDDNAVVDVGNARGVRGGAFGQLPLRARRHRPGQHGLVA
jgi:hypothetical protein